MAELVGLSPSRANDFISCPLKFRFRTIDKIPEPPSPVAFKGTLVHAVLESLFDLLPEQRDLDQARQLIEPHFSHLAQEGTDIAEMFPRPEDREKLFAEAADLLRSYFALELPDKLEPAAREQFVKATLDNGLQLRGFIDRVDVAPAGQVRLVDYKTGRQPKPQYAREAEFQMRFYALLKYKTDQTLVHTLQLFYLGSRSIKSMQPTMSDIERTESEVLSLWDDITHAALNNAWRPRKSPLCSWCSFQAICPAFGNEAPQPPALTKIAGVDLPTDAQPDPDSGQ